jgi:hypothetical protein
MGWGGRQDLSLHFVRFWILGLAGMLGSCHRVAEVWRMHNGQCELAASEYGVREGHNQKRRHKHEEHEGKRELNYDDATTGNSHRQARTSTDFGDLWGGNSCRKNGTGAWR